MRIAISTLDLNYLLTNYGTFLQHYCLRKTLQRLGYEPFRYSATPPPRRGSMLNLLTLLARDLYHILKRRLDYYRGVTALFAQKRMRKVFTKSYRAYIGELEEQQPSADERIIALMGSDQILYNDPKVWFEDLPTSSKRIIYAGSTDWKLRASDPKWNDLAQRLLPTFSAVSVREYAGISLCQQYAKEGTSVHKVIDPVLLADREDLEAMTSTKRVFTKPTLFAYFVNLREPSQLPLSVLESLAKARGCRLKILGIQGSLPFVPIKYRIELSPEKFLAAFRDASVIVTNSFHGAVVALRYQKPFAVLRQVDLPGRDQNVRQIEFLETFGLQRLFCEEASGLNQALATSIDYEPICQKLSELQAESLAWLSKALQEAEKPEIMP